MAPMPRSIPSRRPATLTLLCGALAAASTSAQQSWRMHGLPAADVMAYDAARDRTVLFGGTSGTGNGERLAHTWEWDGSAWSRRLPRHTPPARRRHAMAYDSNRQRTVLFGGLAGTATLGDTWEWDGTDWLERTSAVTPGPRMDHSLAFDPARRRVVLFGGAAAFPYLANLLGDTWEWDGGAWRQATPATSPAPRYDQLMAHDPLRARTVLLGGIGPAGFTADTWEWDGSNWARGAGSAPLVLGAVDAAMSFDGATGRVLLTSFGITSTWDGTTWTLRATSGGPAAVVAMVHDSRRNLVLAGTTASDELWQWNGSAWARRGPASPPWRQQFAGAWDAAAGEAVMFGGDQASGPNTLADTWTWNGGWTQRTPATSPPGRTETAMVEDPASARLLLFGGLRGDYTGPRLDDTWQWDGNNWQLRAPANRPTARHRHAMAHDSARQRVVLFGGMYAAGLVLDDTWEWDGNDWLQRAPAASRPPARAMHGMAYDAARGQVLLHGGTGATAYLEDTWTWDGQVWTQRMPAHRPTPQFDFALAYDAARSRVVLFGGFRYEPRDETWEWDGSDWTRVATATTPEARTGARMVYDPARQRLLLWFGRRVQFGTAVAFRDLWQLGPTGTQTAYGSGCPGSLGVPTLAAAGGSQPVPGGQADVELTGLPRAVALMGLGFSDTRSGPFALPLTLAPFGMPGCSLLADPWAALAVVGSGTAARWTLVIPDTPDLVGVVFFQQAVVLDPGSNAAGLTVTNGLRTTVGF